MSYCKIVYTEYENQCGGNTKLVDMISFKLNTCGNIMGKYMTGEFCSSEDARVTVSDSCTDPSGVL